MKRAGGGKDFSGETEEATGSADEQDLTRQRGGVRAGVSKTGAASAKSPREAEAWLPAGTEEGQ